MSKQIDFFKSLEKKAKQKGVDYSLPNEGVPNRKISKFTHKTNDELIVIVDQWVLSMINKMKKISSNKKLIDASNKHLVSFLGEWKKAKPRKEPKPIQVNEVTVTEIKDDYKYFIVTCRCGHVGQNNYIPIDFPIKAINKKEASNIARELPRVKHDHKFWNLGLREVTIEEYLRQKDINNNDPYLKYKNSSEQDYSLIWDRIKSEDE